MNSLTSQTVTSWALRGSLCSKATQKESAPTMPNLIRSRQCVRTSSGAMDLRIPEKTFFFRISLSRKVLLESVSSIRRRSQFSCRLIS